jgi:hypothetical protein
MPSAGAGAAAGTTAARHIEGDGAVGGGETAVADESHCPNKFLGLNGFAGGADGRFAGLSERLSFLENSVAVVALIFVQGHDSSNYRNRVFAKNPVSGSLDFA